MAAPPPHTEGILQALRRHGGVATSAQLVDALGVSQPTVSRALAPLVRAGRVRKVGAARSQRYLLPRAVAGVGDDIPILRVNTAGVPAPFGRMVPLVGGAFWVDEVDGVSERHDGLPWFLSDMRPQGFMGRNFAQLHPDLHLTQDPRHWSDDDMLRALALRGEDLPGNLIVGDASLARFHTLGQRLARAASPDDYPLLARSALQGQLPGSSAGGEQPKFCCVTQGRSVIVKFSSSGDSPADQRADKAGAFVEAPVEDGENDGQDAGPFMQAVDAVHAAERRFEPARARCQHHDQRHQRHRQDATEVESLLADEPQRRGALRDGGGQEGLQPGGAEQGQQTGECGGGRGVHRCSPFRVLGRSGCPSRVRLRYYACVFLNRA